MRNKTNSISIDYTSHAIFACTVSMLALKNNKINIFGKIKLDKIDIRI